VVIDTPTSLIERQLMETARPALLLLMSLLVLLFGATLLAVRSLRRHQTVLRRLDAAKSNVVVADVRNRAILNSAMDAILSVDGHGKVVTFNGAAERIFEYPADMAIGKSMHELLSISSLKGGPESLFETLQENDGQKVTRVRRELEAVRRSGEIFPAEISVVPVQIGRDWLLTISIRDITDRKKLERQNGLLLDQYRQSALDLSTHKHALDEHALVSINDPEGTVVYANDKLLAVLDYEREDLIGKKLYNLREPSLSDWDYAQMRRAQVLGDIWHGELAFRDRSGKVLWFSSSIIPVKSTDGLVREFITIQTDITDRKEAEQAIANAQQRELQIGARIQESLLISSTDPRVNGLAVSGFSRSLLGINGDFYEITKVGDDMVDIVAGDVMGKGIPAALLGAATKMQLNRSLVDLLLQNADAKLPEPSEIVSDLNRVIGPHLQSLNAFVTLVYLRIDVKNQRVTWVGCGHEETLCIRADGQHEYLPNQHPPVGVLLDETFEQSCMALSEGDAIFLCSDGVSDALINESDRYGRDRLTGSVVTQFSHKKTATMTLQGLYREVVERITPTDDVMMLMVVREAVQDNHWRMELASNLQSIDAARSLLDKAFSDTRCSETRAGLFKVATVEAITNVIRHGLGEVQDAKLEMIVVKSDDRLTVDLLYLGDAFMPSGDLNEIDLSSYPEGGFGLFIMRQACDELIFSHSQEVNRTRLVCHLIDDSLH
jgi:PAS domain S-box-containing protein